MDDVIKNHTPAFAIWNKTPVNVDEYLENSVIRKDGRDFPYEKEKMKVGYFGKDSFIKPIGSSPYGKPTVYYDFIVSGDVFRITYMCFYPLNDGYLFGKVGFHYGDWEHCTIEYSSESFEPLRMYFGAHGSKEGRWVDWKEVEKTIEGKPIVYVSARSNASYPRARCYPRIFGFANDKTRLGIIVKDVNLRWIQAEVWFKYRGKIGCNRAKTKGEIRNVKHAGWYKNESEVSTNSLKQFFALIY